ncbi:MAG: DEAD/DEAH box helicase, partial [Pseudomonadota bacterium]
NSRTRNKTVTSPRYPELEESDVEAVRQRAVAALNITQGAKAAVLNNEDTLSANTALIDGVRKFALSVRDLDIDLNDAINPFGEAYSILAKSMDEDSLKQVASVIAAKRNTVKPDEAVTWAKRASKFKKDLGRSPSVTATDPYERLMAEGATAFMRFRKEGRYE